VIASSAKLSAVTAYGIFVPFGKIRVLG